MDEGDIHVFVCGLECAAGIGFMITYILGRVTLLVGSESSCDDYGGLLGIVICLRWVVCDGDIEHVVGGGGVRACMYF